MPYFYIKVSGTKFWPANFNIKIGPGDEANFGADKQQKFNVTLGN